MKPNKLIVACAIAVALASFKIVEASILVQQQQRAQEKLQREQQRAQEKLQREQQRAQEKQQREQEKLQREQQRTQEKLQREQQRTQEKLQREQLHEQEKLQREQQRVQYREQQCAQWNTAKDAAKLQIDDIITQLQASSDINANEIADRVSQISCKRSSIGILLGGENLQDELNKIVHRARNIAKIGYEYTEEEMNAGLAQLEADRAGAV